MGISVKLVPLDFNYFMSTLVLRNFNRKYFLYNKIITPEQHEKFIKDIMSSTDKWCYVVLYKNTQVGTIGIKEIIGDVGEINWVLLADEFRGLGIMEKAFKQLFAKHQYMMYTLEVKENNQRAINFYKKIGFIPTISNKNIYYMQKVNEQFNSAS